MEAASAPPQEESEGQDNAQLSTESETIQRQGESAALTDGVANQPIMRRVQVTPPPIMPPTIVQMRAELGLVQRMCSECEAELADKEDKEPIQTKLTVGAPGDHYEQEADRVAAQVMTMPAVPESSPQVQRREEEDSPIQRSFTPPSITPLVQRQVDESVQMRSLLQRSIQGDLTQASGDLESRLNASKGGGSPLAPEVQAFMEPRFGADFSAVRVHTGGEAVQMNRELGAQAFTHGSDVYFGAGKSPGNNELTAHELTHVVQQTGANSLIQRQGWDTTPGGGQDIWKYDVHNVEKCDRVPKGESKKSFIKKGLQDNCDVLRDKIQKYITAAFTRAARNRYLMDNNFVLPNGYRITVEAWNGHIEELKEFIKGLENCLSIYKDRCGNDNNYNPEPVPIKEIEILEKNPKELIEKVNMTDIIGWGDVAILIAAGIISQLDSPAPGPGDAAAVAVAGSRLTKLHQIYKLFQMGKLAF
ncbi:MAG TPA: hypothetical protein DC064_31645 [Cyanobacteria bacterium UBA9273]|nr:hypothetical protein [Cyanobacteria bacterium UBA9273]